MKTSEKLIEFFSTHCFNAPACEAVELVKEVQALEQGSNSRAAKLEAYEDVIEMLRQKEDIWSDVIDARNLLQKAAI